MNESSEQIWTLASARAANTVEANRADRSEMSSETSLILVEGASVVL